MPQVSVVIPAFNAKHCIRTAIASALGQSFRDLEIIVVDDGSSDGSLEAVRAWFDGEPRVRVIDGRPNRGPAHARNLAIAAADSEWIALLDADDWYAADRVETLVRIGKESEADIVGDNQFLVSDRRAEPFGVLFPPSRHAVRQLSLREYLAHNLPGRGLGWGLVKPLIRRKFLLDHGIRYRTVRFGEDFIFYAQCLERGGRFILYREPLYYYRYIHEDRMTEADDVMDLLKGNEVVEELLRAYPEHAALLRRRRRLILLAARYERVRRPLKEGRFRAAASEIKKDVGILPFAAYRLARATGFRAIRRIDTAGW